MEPTSANNLPGIINSVKMRFRPNILGGGVIRPSWIGSYNGLVVFPDQWLSQLIENQNLVNKLINVDLEIRNNAHNDKCRYEASVSFPDNGTTASEDLAWQEISGCLGPCRQKIGRQTVILIDGQNIISCYRKVASDNKPSLISVIETIISGTYRVASARLYLCEDEIKNGNDQEIKLLQANQQIKIISEPVKKIQNNYGGQQSIVIKRNIDSIIIADVMETACLGKEGLQCLALFSGDSDYVDVLRRWLRLRPNGVVHIFAFAGSVAKELLELANDSRAMVFLLDQQIAELSGN